MKNRGKIMLVVIRS